MTTFRTIVDYRRALDAVYKADPESKYLSMTRMDPVIKTILVDAGALGKPFVLNILVLSVLHNTEDSRRNRVL